MASRPQPQKPFDVTLTDQQKTQLANDLCLEIEDALMARGSVIGQGGKIDLADFYYEQGQSEATDRPFVGAADLTSYLIYEKISALRARLMKAVFGVRPFCFVEGWGQDAKKAPYVEEFHDWQVRKGDLPLELSKTIHGALIEDGYILEVSERIETRRIIEELDVALELGPDGQPVFTDGTPKLQVGPDGEPVPAQEGQAAAKIQRDYTKTKRLGPQYDAISLKDFVFLPGHAKNQKQVYGYAYRLWERVPTLKERAKDKIYDADAVAAVGESRDRDRGEIPAPVDTIASQDTTDTIDVELFQVSLKRDLDRDGREEWYVLTVHLPSRTILRCKLDTFVMKVGISRCVPFILFPRRNSIYGYSFAFDHLMTLAEEHTALRNMKADRGALATNAPLKVLRGALFDPETQALGVGRHIYVNEMTEVQPMVYPDVPNSAVQQALEITGAAERVSGLADAAFIGALSQEERTLGENQMAAGGSAVRVDEVVGHLHLAIAQVMLLSNAIWVETLQADGKGLDAPQSVLGALAARGQDLQDGKFTADMLTGNFQFEPYGSDTSANPQRRRADFNAWLQALANLSQAFPALKTIMASPDVAKAILEQGLREYDVRDRQPFLNAFQANPMQAAPTTPGGGPAPMANQPPTGAPVNPMQLAAAAMSRGGPMTGAPNAQ